MHILHRKYADGCSKTAVVNDNKILSKGITFGTTEKALVSVCHHNHQYNLILNSTESLSKIISKFYLQHQYKKGLDYRTLVASITKEPFSESTIFDPRPCINVAAKKIEGRGFIVVYVCDGT